MVAVCPNCHDAIHFGQIPISDFTIYQWKNQARAKEGFRSHIYVEPATSAEMILGTLAFALRGKLLVFELSPLSRLKFELKEQEIVLVSLSLSSLSGEEVVSVVDGHVRGNLSSIVQFTQRPGQILVTANSIDAFVPAWALNKQRAFDPDFGLKTPQIVLSLEVIAPGKIRVEGVWGTGDKLVVVTESYISFLVDRLLRPVALVGGQGAKIVIGDTLTSDRIERVVFGDGENALFKVMPPRKS